MAALRTTRTAASLVLCLACGRGGDVDLGRVRPPASSGQGGGGSGAQFPCGAVPCADHSGSKTFVTPGTPADAPARFASATRHPAGSAPEREPLILYPSHETMIPINVSRILHEWSADLTSPLFELAFTGPKTRVTVYTTELRFTPGDEEWDYIAESNRGSAVKLEISAIDAVEPGSVWTSQSIDVFFSDADVEGAIYYWSTATEGVMRALVSDPVPVKFYPDPATGEKATCVGCHSLSRDGKRLAVALDGDRVQVVSVADRSALFPAAGTGGAAGMPGVAGAPGSAGTAGGGGKSMPETPDDPKGSPSDPKAAPGVPGTWTTFSPDGELLLVAAGGALQLFDAESGEPVGAELGVVPTPAGRFATQPDWSALGDRVVYTLAEKGGAKDVERGSIAVVDYRDGAWGSTDVLVESAGDNNFSPVFSPDSRYVAYVNATGGSKDAPSAVIRLVRVADRVIFDLPRLNERVGATNGVTALGNSMPTWAPTTRSGVFWLAFSSLRGYGTVRPADEKLDQLWIAAIDPEQPDPSYAAFWAPFQNLDHGNHRAFWTHGGEDSQCGCTEVCGDRVDNDCDGTADEPECVSSCMPREVCGDGADNDCNCVVDDCQVEICGDGVDNDGDGLADAQDPTCPGP